MIDQEQVIAAFKQLQDHICSGLESVDGTGKFKEDLWQRPEGGGGRTRVILGEKIEKGGVNFSAVHGMLSPAFAKIMAMETADFFATGVSIVLHPRSPMCPIIHMNVRFFQSQNRWWFGGGIDLTPHYVDKTDARLFHERLKQVCDAHHPDFYTKYKAQADEYFYLPHRHETRGVGGIFYDYLNTENTGLSQEELLRFSIDVGHTFVPAYREQIERCEGRPWGENEKKWQYLRRGRYAEFNLVWDKGTKFGLETNGRTESILMSLPPQAQWDYDHRPEPNSAEQRTLDLLKKDVNWLEA